MPLWTQLVLFVRDKNKTLICPECNGEGYVNTPNFDDFVVDMHCFYCHGFGYATDDDTEERFYK